MDGVAGRGFEDAISLLLRSGAGNVPGWEAGARYVGAWAGLLLVEQASMVM